MLARLSSASIGGLDTEAVDVEVDYQPDQSSRQSGELRSKRVSSGELMNNAG